jgi:hypothetical protein
LTRTYLTTSEVAERFPGVAGWMVRRALDGMGTPVPRAGLYRLVPEESLPQVEAELRRRGYLREEASHAAQ